MRYLLSAVFLLISLSSTAAASQWRFSSADPQSVEVYQVQTISNSSDRVEVWFEEAFLVIGTGRVTSTKTLMAFDCRNMQGGALQFIQYDNRGKVLKSFSFDDLQMLRIVPDSRGEYKYKKVCGPHEESEIQTVRSASGAARIYRKVRQYFPSWYGSLTASLFVRVENCNVQLESLSATARLAVCRALTADGQAAR